MRPTVVQPDHGSGEVRVEVDARLRNAVQQVEDQRDHHHGEAGPQPDPARAHYPSKVPHPYSHCSMTSPTRQAGLWVGLVAVTVFIAHLPSFFHRLLDGDEAIYSSIAALLNMGGQLFGSGGVDNKPPGIFWVYAATFRLAGTYQMTAVHAAGLTAMAATCVLICVMARDLA